MRLYDRFKRHVQVTGLLSPGEGVVVACSGGADSVVLLDLLSRLSKGGFELRLHVAHADHGLREDSAEDCRFVRKIASDLGVDFSFCELQMDPDASGTEATARELRYDFLLQRARETASAVVAAGHHADDQVETVLFRILRGTGVRGLAGIPASRQLDEDVRLVRPLLPFTRREILDYAAARGLDYVDDATNFEPIYARNRMRLEILPALRRRFPHLDRALLDLSASAEDVYEGTAHAAEEFLARALVEDSTSPAFRLETLEEEGRFFLARALERAYELAGAPRDGLFRTHYETFFSMVERGQPPSASLPGGLFAEIVRDTLVFRRSPRPAKPDPVEFAPGGDASFGEWKIFTRVIDLSEKEFREFLEYKTPLEEMVDADKAGNALTLRARERGDRFRPLGMKGEKRLSDFFNDLKLTRYERDDTALLVTERGVLWVVGMRIADWAAVDHTTTRCLLLKAERAGD